MSYIHFPDYELIDTGGFEKLERFGKYIIARPEPQALWDKSLSQHEWEKMSHAYFKHSGKVDEMENSERGTWIRKPDMPDQWIISYGHNDMQFKMRLGMTAYKHVGIFHEQADNWDYIYNQLTALQGITRKVLNLFAYTGGASLAAKAAGADVTHVDSVRQVVNWASDNMKISQQQDIRWVVEDAMKYVGDLLK